jgi:hypothetical protein
VETVLLLLALVLLVAMLLIVPLLAFRLGQWMTERFRR